jgi:adenine-specific DNA-methyltransferase
MADGKNEQPEKLELRSLDPAEARRAEIARLFPEAHTEGGKIDFDQLKRALGEAIDGGRERYGLVWPGKADCFRTIQAPSIATLRPAPEESVNFDTTKNLIIEGDNLEVLKLLQKSYLGKIKMIYIDPPYNTGNDFIYPDNFSENLQTYLEYTGQIDSEGRKFGTNTEAEGRYHSKWLNMMYPRLYLARNLLKDDGCIFISIDDVELSGLRFVCDEIFGSEHFCGLVSRSTGTRMGEGSATLSSELDYILIYSKTDEVEFAGLPMTEDDLSIYDQHDERGQYLIRSLRRTGGENRREDRPSMFYPVRAPDGTEIFPIAPAGYESRWVCSSATYQRLVGEGLIEWKKMRSDGVERWQVYQKHYVGSATKQPSNLWADEEGNKKATRDLNALFDGLKVFDHPKPLGLVQRMATLSTAPSGGDIILDFFAGSGTTGHAVWLQNLVDQGDRCFIMVQLPERLDVAIKAHQVAADVCEKIGVAKTVAELTKERMRRAFSNIEAERKQRLGIGEIVEATGFRVFKLAESNFKTWDADAAADAGKLERQLEMHVDHLRGSRTAPDFLYEILLKSGFPLTAKVDQVKLGGQDVFSVAGGALLICLERKLTLETIRAMAHQKPERAVCLDDGFAGNDQLKTNAVQTFKSKGIVFRTV